jgi:hypothetical protein
MKVEHVLADEDELADALVGQDIDDISLELHDVVFDGIVPLADEFEHGNAVFVISVEYFEK